MKVRYKTVKERRNRILSIVQKHGKVDVATLAREFKVTETTIRRDLLYLENQNAIIRYYGGAKFVQEINGFEEESFSNEAYKDAIAKKAASFVENGDTIFLNSSTTALEMIKYIKNRRVSIITNNAKAILTVEKDPLVTIVLTSGELLYPRDVLVGKYTLKSIRQIKADKAFIGCSGISKKAGITSAFQYEINIGTSMIRQTKGKVFVLADYTKIGNDYPFNFGEINDIDYLITNTNASEEELEKINNGRITILKEDPQ